MADLRYTAPFAPAVAASVSKLGTSAMIIVGVGAVGVKLRCGVRRSERRFDARIEGIAAGDIA